MKICIYGTGAIGGYMAVKLKRSGADVTCIARGAHLRAIRENGLKLLINDEEHTEYVPCTDNPGEIGVQDYVIIALKAPSLHDAADAMTPLFHKGTSVVTAQNGIPWWYFYKSGGDFEGTRLASVDRGNRLWDTIGPERAIGCVVYPAATVVEPGVIRHTYGSRFSLGEPDGSRSDRLRSLAAVMSEAGFQTRVRTKIRDEIWVKLWGNLSINPISTLTSATIRQIVENEGTHAIVRSMMIEAKRIAEALDIRFKIDVDKRIAGALEVGHHKTSMLQDLEKGRTLEIDALLSAVQELAGLCNIKTPTIDMVLSLVKLRARLAGCYADPGQGESVMKT